jgi:hypothetical protein
MIVIRVIMFHGGGTSFGNGWCSFIDSLPSTAAAAAAAADKLDTVRPLLLLGLVSISIFAYP